MKRLLPPRGRIVSSLAASETSRSQSSNLSGKVAILVSLARWLHSRNSYNNSVAVITIKVVLYPTGMRATRSLINNEDATNRETDNYQEFVREQAFARGNYRVNTRTTND